jgi:hypothetical protein
MKVLVAGSGKVGTALKSFFNRSGISFKEYLKDSEPLGDIIFLALSDSVVSGAAKNIASKNSSIKIIQFTPAVEIAHENQFILHPYASITKEADISTIFFSLWGKKDPFLETMLHHCRLNFFHAGAFPTPGYHASAVISGNFTQYFVLVAKKILEHEGFSDDQSSRFIKQLMLTSLDNSLSGGIEKITGPASRGDDVTIEKEAAFLESKNKEISNIFRQINKLISEAVKSGNVL